MFESNKMSLPMIISMSTDVIMIKLADELQTLCFRREDEGNMRGSETG